ncbi:hypothetical protein EU96_1744 [Prochlorococcus marinus str. MIT 9302]|uniref:Uncharacterized protein n=1 Tax=Prochlorococcus marinus str. MIT 9302 TaxID=74545 RepID=A0A0A2A9L5_PROMR|nr:hypothetical protein [Prochlorococcus marinus]KGF97103.1 hypothetical protein EU96_1744 [Prochlorococcus marinus str. MIT 9302]
MSSSGLIISIKEVNYMSCGNTYKHMIKNAFTPFWDAISSEKKLSDEKLECMQFGICDYRPEQVEEVPFFHY